MKTAEGVELEKLILDMLFPTKFSIIHTKNNLNLSVVNSKKVNFINMASSSSRRAII